MAEPKPRRRKPEPFEVPIADKGEIAETYIFRTADEIWQHFALNPALEKAEPALMDMLKYAVYTGILESVRLTQFRMNFDQNFSVFEELGKELGAYNQCLHQIPDQPPPPK